MTDLENFHFTLTHAKLELIGIQEGFSRPHWDDKIQNQLNSLSAFHNFELELEAHLIAVQEFFKERFTYEEVIGFFHKCLSITITNKNSFTTLLYNLCVSEIQRRKVAE